MEQQEGGPGLPASQNKSSRSPLRPHPCALTSTSLPLPCPRSGGQGGGGAARAPPAARAGHVLQGRVLAGAPRAHAGGPTLHPLPPAWSGRSVHQACMSACTCTCACTHTCTPLMPACRPAPLAAAHRPQVRDAACLACGRCVTAFPQESREVLEVRLAGCWQCWQWWQWWLGACSDGWLLAVVGGWERRAAKTSRPVAPPPTLPPSLPAPPPPPPPPHTPGALLPVVCPPVGQHLLGARGQRSRPGQRG